MMDVNDNSGKFENTGNNSDESKPDKKIRKRKKKLYQAIRTQMEFYFSDSNLMKDKFLSKLISDSENGYIELAVFLRFNKIRALTDSQQEIAAALSKCEMVEVSEDGTLIKRVNPVVEKENVDECTIYVEHLPLNADHSWIQNIFSSFGTISYISLPRYKHTGKSKGFAFVEFETMDSAHKACKHYGSLLGSPGREECDETAFSESSTEKVERSLKRKRSECEDDNPKRMRSDSKEIQDTNVAGSQDNNDENTPTERKHKKKRKRKKKQKSEEEEQLNLRVMSKVEWKKFRNKYLSLQKAATAQIKKSLLGDGYPTYKNFTPTHEEENQKEEIEEAEKVKTLEFQPGVIVLVELDHPPASLSDFKNQARSLTNIAYIEAMEGDTTVYIRCADPDSANTYVKSARSGLNGTSRILEGDEEKTYWDKIQKDRENKYLSKTKRKKRGIEKVMTKAEKIVEKSRHIRFEDD